DEGAEHVGVGGGGGVGRDEGVEELDRAAGLGEASALSLPLYPRWAERGGAAEAAQGLVDRGGDVREAQAAAGAVQAPPVPQPTAAGVVLLESKRGTPLATLGQIQGQRVVGQRPDAAGAVHGASQPRTAAPGAVDAGSGAATAAAQRDV